MQNGENTYSLSNHGHDGAAGAVVTTPTPLAFNRENLKHNYDTLSCMKTADINDIVSLVCLV